MKIRDFLLMAFAPLLCWQAPVQARVYFITNTDDTISVNSLRGAIIDANKNGGDNSILLGPALLARLRSGSPVVLPLSRAGADENAAYTGDLDVTRGQLSIMVPAAGLTIDATGLGDRIFQVFIGASLTLRNVTLTGGTAPQAQPGSFYSATSGAEDGGAVWNEGTLNMFNCIVTNNASGDGNYDPGNGVGRGGGFGGGIYNSGTMNASGCLFVNNRTGGGVDGAAGGDGGGLGNFGTCSLSKCVFSGNQSGNGGDPAGNAIGLGGVGGNGGGIFNFGKMTLTQCRLEENAAGTGADGGSPSGLITIFTPGGPGGKGGEGGGIYNDGTIHLTLSTIASNASGNGGNGDANEGIAGNGGDGAGIFNDGQLSLNACMIRENVCGIGGAGGNGFFVGGSVGGTGGSGAGIFNAGTFSSSASIISFNLTGTGGSGGDCQDFLFLTNSPGVGGAGGNGGGLFNQGRASFNSTTICSNLCDDGGIGGTDTSSALIAASGDGGGGGGIYSMQNLIMTNCTLTGNTCGDSVGPLDSGSSGGSGGGIFNGGKLLLTSCTITANATGLGSTNISPGGGRIWILDGSGGGVANLTNAAWTIVRNSIIAGNLPLGLIRTPGGPSFNTESDVSGSFSSQGFNLIGFTYDDFGFSTDTSGFVNGVKADQVGGSNGILNPLLGPLQMNGGAAPTQALLPGSPAIDQGKAFSSRTDQRGSRRPHDFSSVPNAAGGDGSDIGAFEL